MCRLAACLLALLIDQIYCEEVVATVKFNLWGTVVFRQTGLDPVRVEVDLELSGVREADNWHVHELPRGASDCSDIGPHFRVPDGSPAGELATNGQALMSGVNVFNVTPGHGLSLNGVDSIVGRSVGVSMDDGTIRCASIVPNFPLTTLVANFQGPLVFGTVKLQQREGHPEGDTTVTVSLVGPPTGHNLTSGNETAVGAAHSWHVHEFSVQGDAADELPERCMSVGGHFDPGQTNVDCTPTAPWLRCEAGDLSGKHGPVVVGRRYVFTDSELPLSGNNSLANRSIAIHSVNGPARIGCATITGVVPRGQVCANCSGHGICSADSQGDPLCVCHDGWMGYFCEQAQPAGVNDTSYWGNIALVVGIVTAIICVERLISSCRKIYRKRQGRSTAGFAQVPVLTANGSAAQGSDSEDGDEWGAHRQSRSSLELSAMRED